MVHDSTGDFHAHVLVDGERLEEYRHQETGDTYVMATFDKNSTYKVESHETDPWGEPFTQEWPVTPYEVQVVNNSKKDAWAHVLVDGKLARKTVVNAGKTRTIIGFQEDAEGHKGATKEFLFTVPVLPQPGQNVEAEVTAEEKAKLESIRVEFYEAAFKYSTIKNRTAASPSTAQPIDKAVAKAAQVHSTSRSGKQMKAGHVGQQSVKIYSSGALKGEAKLRYSTRPKLQRLGLVPEDEEERAPRVIPRRRRQGQGQGAGAARAAAVVDLEGGAGPATTRGGGGGGSAAAAAAAAAADAAAVAVAAAERALAVAAAAAAVAAGDASSGGGDVKPLVGNLAKRPRVEYKVDGNGVIDLS